jgi:hypothetical protein
VILAKSHQVHKETSKGIKAGKKVMSEVAKSLIQGFLKTATGEMAPETEPTNPSLMLPSESENDYSMVSLPCVLTVIDANFLAISGVQFAMIGSVPSSSARVAELGCVTRTLTSLTWGV